MQVSKPTKDENLAEIANIIAANSIRANVDNTIQLLDVYKGIVGKTAQDKRNMKEEQDRLEKLQSPEYAALLRNALADTYSGLSEEHVQRLLDQMIFELKIGDCEVAAYAKITALSEEFFAGTYQGPTEH